MEITFPTQSTCHETITDNGPNIPIYLPTNIVSHLKYRPVITKSLELLQPLTLLDECGKGKEFGWILPVECGRHTGLLYLSKLCQGSRGESILFNGSWFTPNEFQLISGRLAAKDWKRSIRHNGRSLKLLIGKGVIQIHSPLCECVEQRRQRMELLRNNEKSNHHQLSNHHHILRKTMTSNGNKADPRRLTSIIDHLLVSRNSEESGTLSNSSSSPDDWNEFLPHSTSTKGLSHLSQSIDLSLDEKVRIADKSGMNDPTQFSTSGWTKQCLQFTAASTESGDDEHQNSGTQITSNLLTSSGVGAGPTTTITNTSTKSGGKTSKKRIPVKTERHSPESVRSSPSPSGGKSGGGSGIPSPPLKQMEQMMGRNYSDFMRSLAAKYNHTNPNEHLYSSAAAATRSASFTFDSRFLKPGAAAAAASLLAFQHHQDKIPFPLIDMSSTQTLLSMVRSATASGPTPNGTPPIPSIVPSKRSTSPLDLSPGMTGNIPSPSKKSKLLPHSHHQRKCVSNCSGCSSEADTIVNGWTVDDVCRFVGSIDLCAEYVQAFREHSIDGSSLPLLTEDHLIQNMSMKLGPALKFKSTVAKRMGNCPVCSHCTHCHLSSSTSSSSPDHLK